MYRKILLALDHTESDQTVLAHVPPLAGLLKCELLLLHVADGWVARNFDQLQLASSEEMRDDWDYLERTATRLREQTGLTVKTCLALGNPPTQIVKVTQQEHCDLIVMVSHGHKLIGDILHGSTIDAVRHHARVPVLAIPAEKVAERASSELREP
jgi:manganese transport protein